MDLPAAVEAQLSVRGQLRQLLPLVGGLGIYVALLIMGSAPRWFSVGGVVVLGGFSVAGVVGALRSSRAGIVLRLDEAGVTRKGSLTVPWTDLSEIVISSLLPWWRGGDGGEVVAFVPRSGVDVPGPPTASGRDRDFGQHQRVRRYGSNLVVLTSGLTARADELAAYAHRVGGLPVRRHPTRHIRPRFWVAVLIVGIVALVAGLVAGLG